MITSELPTVEEPIKIAKANQRNLFISNVPHFQPCQFAVIYECHCKHKKCIKVNDRNSSICFHLVMNLLGQRYVVFIILARQENKCFASDSMFLYFGGLLFFAQTITHFALLRYLFFVIFTDNDCMNTNELSGCVLRPYAILCFLNVTPIH